MPPVLVNKDEYNTRLFTGVCDIFPPCDSGI